MLYKVLLRELFDLRIKSNVADKISHHSFLASASCKTPAVSRIRMSWQDGGQSSSSVHANETYQGLLIHPEHDASIANWA